MSKLYNLFKDNTPEQLIGHTKEVCALIKQGKIKQNELSILDVAESTLGLEAVRTIRDAHEDGVGMAVKESADPVNLTAFSNITQLLVNQNVVQQYQKPEFIGDMLVTSEISREDNTQEPGLALIDDKALVVPEGMEYPDVKFGEDYIYVPPSQKRGMKIALTREMVFFDRTGLLMKQANAVGERLGTDRELRILRVVLGLSNTFKRKGVARNTYVSSADPRINSKSSTPLVDWTSIDVANQLFTAMLDDRTVGEPIQVTPDTIIVSKYKEMNARRILSATMVREGTNLTSGYPSRTADGANPANSLPFNIVTSPWLDYLLVNEGSISASNAKDYWTIGQPKKAFKYRTLFPLQVRAANPNNTAEFERDVVMQYRADERGVCYVDAPWYVAQLHNA